LYIQYTHLSSYITYNLEPFCDTKTHVCLVPCHIQKQKLNEENTMFFSYMCYSFTSRWFFLLSFFTIPSHHLRVPSVRSMTWQTFEITKSQVLLFCEVITHACKLWLRSFKRKIYIHWKYISNTILHILIWINLTLDYLVLVVENQIAR
jgi:hypothetical protein